MNRSPSIFELIYLRIFEAFDMLNFMALPVRITCDGILNSWNSSLYIL